MRRSPILVTAAAALLLTACAPSTETPAVETSAPQTSPAASAPPTDDHRSPTDGVQVSPGGVTTAVDAPANATESGYGQACLAGRAWFDGRQGERQALVEEYLQTLQAPGAVGPGSLDMPWADLTPGQQAAVIMAANAAARAECG